MSAASAFASMRGNNVFRARAFRLALAFCLAISAATAAIFTVIYLQVSGADVQRVGAVLVDEAAKSEADSPEQLRQALDLRLTRDIRRLDYVAMFGASGSRIFGNVPTLPAIPADGRAHEVRQLLPDASAFEPALFVARRRQDGDVLLLGRSLREVYDLQKSLLEVLAAALLPTILVILGIGAVFARRATQRFERIYAAIVRVMNGEFQSRLPVGNESDDVEKVTRAVNSMLDEIERLLDQLRSIGDNIAHDLRTPLMVARAGLARSLEDDPKSADLRPAMEATLSQIDRASLAISAILRVSAVENGAKRNRFKDFELAALCAEVVDFYEPLAESKSITLSLTVDDPASMRGDEDLMREALANLVDNALKFTPEGGRVRVETRLVDGLPLVVVADNGPGVAPHERSRIFRRFYRGENAPAAPGHGLGLSLAQTIVNLHGFELAVEDNNPGARFTIQAAAKASISLARAAE
jgi:signal transduction histidine kinase